MLNVMFYYVNINNVLNVCFSFSFSLIVFPAAAQHWHMVALSIMGNSMVYSTVLLVDSCYI